MKGRKKSRTRRQIALRRLGAALVLLALVILLGDGGLTPRRALLQTADFKGAGEVEPLLKVGPLPVGKGMRQVYLSANEDVTMLSEVGFSLFRGWQTGSGNVLDCSKPASVHVGQWMVGLRDQWEDARGYGYFFGRIDDPDVQEVAFEYGLKDEEGEMKMIDVFDGGPVVSRREEWVRWQGHNYFAIPYCYDLQFVNGNSGKFFVTVNGTALSPEVWVEDWVSTFFSK